MDPRVLLAVAMTFVVVPFSIAGVAVVVAAMRSRAERLSRRRGFEVTLVGVGAAGAGNEGAQV